MNIKTKNARRLPAKLANVLKQILSILTHSPFPSVARAAGAELRRVERRSVTLSAKR
jgi:hypothetical protein